MRTHLSVEDAAGRLSVSPGLVRKLIRTGHLEAVRVGRCVRIPVASLEVYLARERIRPGQSEATATPRPSGGWRARLAELRNEKRPGGGPRGVPESKVSRSGGNRPRRSK
jgi:excisionase family DNA binding protein